MVTDRELVEQKNYEALYRKYHRLIRDFSRYFKKDCDRDDFCQNAYEYLIKAVDNTRMDTQWSKFSTILTYSLNKLKHDMIKEIYRNSHLSISHTLEDNSMVEPDNPMGDLRLKQVGGCEYNDFYQYSPENMMNHVTVEQKKEKYMKALPKDYRILVELREQGLTTPELAQHINKSCNTVYRIMEECKAFASDQFSIDWKLKNRSDLIERLLKHREKLERVEESTHGISNRRTRQSQSRKRYSSRHNIGTFTGYRGRSGNNAFCRTDQGSI